MSKRKNTVPYDKVSPWIKSIIYIITLISNCSFFGLLGAYSIIKKDVQDQFALQTSLLGFIQSLSFLGRFFGFIYLIFYPSVTLRRDYLISCSMTTFCFLLIPFSTFVPSISSYILSLAFFFSGFFRVYIIVPYLIVTQYFDPVVRNKTSINIWNSIHAMGDVFAILFTYYLLSDLKWSWEASLIANLALYLSFSILMYLVTQDIQLNDEVIGSQRGTTQVIRLTDQDRYFSSMHLSRQSRKSEIIQATGLLKQFFQKDMGNCLWVADYSILCAIYYSILCWFPFYFMALGLKSFVLYVVIMYSLFAPIGTIMFQLLNKKAKILRRTISTTMIGISAVIHIVICFIEESDDNLMLYIGLVSLDGLLQGGTFASISSWELSYRTNSNKQKYLVMSGARLIYTLVIFISMFLIGFLMQISNRAFLIFMAVLISLDAFLCYYRNKKYCLIEPEEKEQKHYIEMEQQ